jgi:hypothetical protein
MAKSDDVDKINNTLIDCVKFEFVKREIVPFRGKKEGSGFYILWIVLLPQLNQLLRKSLNQIRN